MRSFTLLWYGYIYYVASLFLIFLSTGVFFKLFFKDVFFRAALTSTFFKNLVSVFLFFSFLALLSTYSLLDNYSYLSCIVLEDPSDLVYFDHVVVNSILNPYVLSLNYVTVYTLPFFYIFVLITLISILFCLAYNLSEVISFFLYTTLILVAGYVLFFTESVILFFISYEMLLVPSFFVLYNFAKTRRCVEAAYLMFFWTQFGAMFLIFSFLYLFFSCGSSTFSALTLTQLTPFEVNFCCFCWLVGFGVKLPIWPFYGWLPKAHVEASTNFSIFLSGVLVKFAFFGLLKALLSVNLDPTFVYAYPFLVIGITDSVFKLFYQIDLKKLVAYSTVVEMHWLTICLLSGQGPLALATFSMLISHALLSTNSFLIVDAIGRRFKTRLSTEINGLNFLCPKLFLISLVNLLIFLGFPGSLMFISEILFFSFFFDLYPLLSLLLILMLYLLGPTFFFRTWTNVLFGSSNFLDKKLPIDLQLNELLLLTGLIVLMFWLGFTWQAFVF